MSLFTPDLFRNFGIGFVAGALMVGVMTIDHWGEDLAPAAQAAEVVTAPQAVDRFWSNEA